jgi:hypothetical protein
MTATRTPTTPKTTAAIDTAKTEARGRDRPVAVERRRAARSASRRWRRVVGPTGWLDALMG